MRSYYDLKYYNKRNFTFLICAHYLVSPEWFVFIFQQRRGKHRSQVTWPEKYPCSREMKSAMRGKRRGCVSMKLKKKKKKFEEYFSCAVRVWDRMTSRKTRIGAISESLPRKIALAHTHLLLLWGTALSFPIKVISATVPGTPGELANNTSGDMKSRSLCASATHDVVVNGAQVLAMLQIFEAFLMTHKTLANIARIGFDSYRMRHKMKICAQSQARFAPNRYSGS